eukprot:gene3594-6329_t
MFCNISNKVPEEPVVSKKSGLLFEKRLILKYIDEKGVCPVTKETLSEEDLLNVKSETMTKPRTLTSNSIPGLLQTFQNEWDSLMLETFSLKQQNQELRQELSHALYQHDAACRVIARLIKEKEDLKNNVEDSKMEEEEEQESTYEKPVIEIIQNTAKKLSSKRKKRELSDTLATPEFVKNYHLEGSYPLHKTKPAGVSCLDIHPTKNLILTGGNDHTLSIFNKDSSQILSTLKGHTKQVTNVSFNSNYDSLVSSSVDKTIRVWSFDSKKEEYTTNSIIKEHKDVVTDLTLHPSGNYLVSSSNDKTWKFHDLNTAKTILSNDTLDAKIQTCCFHPDGILLGFGDSNNVISIWNILENKIVAKYEGHTNEVVTMSFSENGYHLATGSTDGTVKLWDLKNSRNFQTFEIGSAVKCVNFDHSGNYLSVGSASGSVQVFQNKIWEEISKHQEHKKEVTGVCFGRDAQFLASVSLDRNLKFYSGTLKK